MRDFDKLKETVTSYFTDTLLPGVVEKKRQTEEIDLLKKTLGGRRFFFTVDLTSFEIIEAHSVQQWLGYSDREFTLKKYWSIIPEARRQWLIQVALQIYQPLCKGQYPLAFMVQRFGSKVPLIHNKGKQLLALKTSSVFQYDKNNNLTAYLNEFTILGDYNGEPLAAEFFESTGNYDVENGKKLLKQIKRFIEMKIFSARQLQIARVIAYNPSIKMDEIPAHLPPREGGKELISVNTVKKFCTRLVNKAKKFFKQDFKNVKEVDDFLHREGLL